MAENQVSPDPREVVRAFRETYVNAHELRRLAPSAFPGADIKTPKEKPIKENDLPPGIRALLSEFRRKRPGAKVTVYKYQRIENGVPVTIIEDERLLPDEDKLLSLSETVTLTTSTEVRVITEMVVASVE
jgi:hypothetical protein